MPSSFFYIKATSFFGFQETSGILMATYEYSYNSGTSAYQYKLLDHQMYGMGRVGTYNINEILVNSQEVHSNDASKQFFELTDHLGSVRAVVSGVKTSGNATIVQLTDYHEFGQTMQGRNYVSQQYRFGYQGSEKDGEVDGGAYTTEFRALDVRLGRWMSPDPITHTSWSPYVSMDDNPISCTDIMGLEPDGGENCGTPAEITTPNPYSGQTTSAGNGGGNGGAPVGATLPGWVTLINFEPPQSTYQELEKREFKSGQLANNYQHWRVQKIENAKGSNVNLDYYGIGVEVLPIVDGKRLTAEQLQDYIRTHLNDFFDHKISEFSAYSKNDDKKWHSNDPLNSVMHFDIHECPLIIWIITFGNPEDLSVITTEYDIDHWIFSTISSPMDAEHAVAGNREFGFITNADGTMEFYTRGADRAWGTIDGWMQGIVFGGGHKKWLAYQKKVAEFINNHEGKASRKTPFSQRFNWKDFIGKLKNWKNKR